MADWHELEIAVAVEDEELVSFLLFESACQGVESDPNGAHVRLRAYFTQRPGDGLESSVASYAVPGSRLQIRCMATDELDWSENWKIHFRPQPIGRSLYVCAPWDSGPPNDRIPIIVNPGMAFGTGQHATTRSCLELIEQVCSSEPIYHAVDVGTGSGILAIVMAKLGVQSITAVDNDPEALRAAAENIARNRVERQIHLSTVLEVAPTPYDLIVANLFADLLIEMSNTFARLSTPTARLICSGLVEADESRVRHAFEQCGWTAIKRQSEAPWCAILLARRST